MNVENETPTVEQVEEFAIDVAMQQMQQELRAGAEWNLAEWAVGILHQLDAAEDDVKERAKAHLAYLLSECKGRRAGLLWKYGQAIRQQIEAELTGGKRKSVTYATGKAGFRTVPGRKTLVLDDEAKAIQWAQENGPSLVRRSLDLAGLRHFVENCESPPPGCHWETTEPRENFFVGPVTVPANQLPGLVEPSSQISADEFFDIKP